MKLLKQLADKEVFFRGCAIDALRLYRTTSKDEPASAHERGLHYGVYLAYKYAASSIKTLIELHDSNNYE